MVNKLACLLSISVVVCLLASCGGQPAQTPANEMEPTISQATPPTEEPSAPTLEAVMPTPEPVTPTPEAASLDKWSLWANGTQLRGANTWQRIVVPEVDGPDFLGSGYIGPPYTQADFDALSALGVNYVNLSHPACSPNVRPMGWMRKCRPILIP